MRFDCRFRYAEGFALDLSFETDARVTAPHLTVRQNLEFAARHPVRPIVAWDRLIAVLELRDFLDRSPETLSGGQRQRVALGRALIRGPNLLLMDEPLNAQDQALKDRILDYLERSIHEWHIPTVFVTHDQKDARRLAQRVIALNAGQLAPVLEN